MTTTHDSTTHDSTTYDSTTYDSTTYDSTARNGSLAPGATAGPPACPEPNTTIRSRQTGHHAGTRTRLGCLPTDSGQRQLRPGQRIRQGDGTGHEE
jgi:hypothetical protein